MPTPTASVILVAHGSARSGASAEPVLALARALREMGWPEVRTAFWKEEPFLHQALDGVRGGSVLILPAFLATGYFSGTVVPRELGVRAGLQNVDGRPVALLPPLATDPRLARLVAARASAAAPDDVPLAECLVVVLGHGTPLDAGSAGSVVGAAALLERRGESARAEAAFIDDDPKLDAVLAGAPEPVAIVVPFLMAEGFHGAAVADGGEAWSPSMRVVYTEPIGTHPEMVEVVTSFLEAAPPSPPSGPEGPVARAEPALAAVLAAQGAVAFLQVSVARGADGYELVRAGEEGADPRTLTAIPDPDGLERLARRTAEGAHRPLRTAADLPGGWRYRADDARALAEALVALYGPALAHWEMGRAGGLPVVGFRERAAAQTGMYARLAGAAPAAVEEGIRGICDGLPCLRTRLWSLEGPRTGVSLGPMDVPCPTPCPILLTAVLETGAREVDDPGVSP